MDYSRDNSEPEKPELEVNFQLWLLYLGYWCGKVKIYSINTCEWFLISWHVCWQPLLVLRDRKVKIVAIFP
jgi:hypothetical protein